MQLRSFSLALACYAALSVWFHWDLIRAPGSVLPQPTHIGTKQQPLVWGDELMVVSTIGTVARRILTAPTRLFDLGQCYPFSNSLSLGEPMFVDALVATLPLAITGNPIAAKNVVTITAPIIAGLCMFALILYWTHSVPAALVAGFLFGFDPDRLTDVTHPYVHGNAWAPLAILAAHRLFARQRWVDAALLAVALALQMLESFYPALAFAMVGSVYGTVLAIHHRRVLPALLPKLLAVVAFLVLIGMLAFRPYLGNREAWGILQGRGSFLLLGSDFFMGKRFYLGSVLLLLAVVGLLDRVRRGSGIVFDPRLPLLAGGFFVYWFIVSGINIPFVGSVPSPYVLGMRNLPGISAVRVISAVRSALPFVGACLAGFGLAALLRRCGPRTAGALGAAVFALAAGEIFFHPSSGGNFGVRLRMVDAKPSAALLALFEKLPDGPLLDFPPSRFIPPSTHYVFLHGYHDRPTDACHSSFPNPMRDAIYAMSARLPDTTAALELRTLGIRSIIVHTEYVNATRLELFERWAASDGERAAGLRFIGQADGHLAYAFDPTPAPAGFEAIARPAMMEQHMQTLATCGQPVEFVVRNDGSEFYRHPDPIRPGPVVLTWLDDRSVARATESRTVLMPLVLAPRDKQWVKVVPGVLPPPGSYTVTLQLGDAVGPVLAKHQVVVATACP